MLVETKCPAYNKISEKMSSQDDLTSWVLLSWAEITNRWLYKYMYKYYMQSARVVLLSGVQTFGCVPYFKNSYLRMKSANNWLFNAWCRTIVTEFLKARSILLKPLLLSAFYWFTHHLSNRFPSFMIILSRNGTDSSLWLVSASCILGSMYFVEFRFAAFVFFSFGGINNSFVGSPFTCYLLSFPSN